MTTGLCLPTYKGISLGRFAAYATVAILSMGCHPKQTNRLPPPKEATVVLDAEKGVPGLIDFGDTPGTVQKRLGPPLIYTDNDSGYSYVFDKVYGATHCRGRERIIYGLRFNFYEIEKETSVTLKLHLKVRNHNLVLSKDSTLEQVEKQLGCRDEPPVLKKGVTTATSDNSGAVSKPYALTSSQPDKPCQVDVIAEDALNPNSALYIRSTQTHMSFLHKKLRQIDVYDL